MDQRNNDEDDDDDDNDDDDDDDDDGDDGDDDDVFSTAAAEARRQPRQRLGRALPHPLHWLLRAEKHRRRTTMSGGGNWRYLRQTSLTGRMSKANSPSRQRKSGRYVMCSKLRSIADKTSTTHFRLSPDGCPSRTLHFLAESGVLLHSFIRLWSPDCWSSVRIPSVLNFVIKYCASVTAASSM